MDAVDVIEESNRKFRTDEINAYMATDNEFIVFLKNFVEMQKQKDDLKLHLKDQFFWLVMISFLVLIVTPLIIVLVAHKYSDITVIVALVASLVELVTAIIVLPKIIAKYLFNKEEDAHMLKIINSMQRYNEKKHDYIGSSEKNNKSIYDESVDTEKNE